MHASMSRGSHVSLSFLCAPSLSFACACMCVGRRCFGSCRWERTFGVPSAVTVSEHTTQRSRQAREREGREAEAEKQRELNRNLELHRKCDACICAASRPSQLRHAECGCM